MNLPKRTLLPIRMNRTSSELKNRERSLMQRTQLRLLKPKRRQMMSIRCKSLNLRQAMKNLLNLGAHFPKSQKKNTPSTPNTPSKRSLYCSLNAKRSSRNVRKNLAERTRRALVRHRTKNQRSRNWRVDTKPSKTNSENSN